MADIIVPNNSPETPEDYFKGIDYSDLKKSSTLKDNYSQVLTQNPDQAAQIVNLSKQFNESPEFIANNLDQANKAATAPDFDQIAKDFPHLSNFLGDTKKMAMAYDDIHNLKHTEEITQAHNLFQDALAGFQGSGSVMLARQKMPTTVLPPDASIAAQIAAGAGGFIGGTPAFFAGGLAGLIPGVVAGPLAPYVAGAGAFAAEDALKQMVSDHIQHGDIQDTAEFMRRLFSTGKAAVKGGAVGAAMAGGGALGLKVLEGPVASSIERSLPYGAQFAIGKGAQAATRAVGEVAGMTVGGAAVEGKLPQGKNWLLNSLMIAMFKASHLAGTTIKDVRLNSINAEAYKSTIENLAEARANGKTPERATPEYNEFVDKQIGPSFISVAKFETLFQNDSENVAKALNVEESYKDAKANGGFVSIPVSTMISKTMDTYRPKMMDDIKGDIEKPSVNEIKEADIKKQELIKQYSAESDKAITANPALQAVHDTISKDFAAIASPAMQGVKGRGAKSSVDLVSKVVADRYITEAGKRGVDALTLYNADKPIFFGPVCDLGVPLAAVYHLYAELHREGRVQSRAQQLL